jgi:hypothetical protein
MNASFGFWFLRRLDRKGRDIKSQFRMLRLACFVRHYVREMCFATPFCIGWIDFPCCALDASKSGGSKGNDRRNEIEQRANEIWMREGRPSGEHGRHWYQASNGPTGILRFIVCRSCPKLVLAPTKVERALGRHQKTKAADGEA